MAFPASERLVTYLAANDGVAGDAKAGLLLCLNGVLLGVVNGDAKGEAEKAVAEKGDSAKDVDAVFCFFAVGSPGPVSRDGVDAVFDAAAAAATFALLGTCSFT